MPVSNVVMNIYCDESCHLPSDGVRPMVIGAVLCPKDKARTIAEQIRGIKSLNGLNPRYELKWTKISKGKLKFYLSLIDYFFNEEDLRFRAIVVPDKATLSPNKTNQEHDSMYYKMYFDMLKVLLDPDLSFNIYLDIKDTRGGAKVAELFHVLKENVYDYRRDIIQIVQQVDSDEVEQVQLADLLIGCVSHINRNRPMTTPKGIVADRMRLRSGYKLTQSTLLTAKKVNLFRCDNPKSWEE